jgi:hypothetical protein
VADVSPATNGDLAANFSRIIVIAAGLLVAIKYCGRSRKNGPKQL